ncbi:MAG: hypothetical protein ACI35Y_02530 [Candidatus Limimorpha sp.]|nr:hypothetical protein [Bacteroidales bacterium]MDD7277585.1 hypothetical protein [Bacteroidales bacterium]MDY6076000.1 hypothetical protein [Bacteroidales bacterium]
MWLNQRFQCRMRFYLTDDKLQKYCVFVRKGLICCSSMVGIMTAQTRMAHVVKEEDNVKPMIEN